MKGGYMPHVFRLLFWSVGVAIIAWVLKLIFDDEKALTPEALVSRIRNSGF